MPETINGLWKQRLRWSMGGIQVILKYAHKLLAWRQRRMWIIWVEYVASVAWSYAMFLILVLWGLSQLVTLPPALHVGSNLPAWPGVIIGSTCLLQFLVSLLMDRRYEPNLLRYYFWMVWYPLAYWMLTMLTSVWALPKTLLRRRGKRAVWVSPDRGVQQEVTRK